MNEDKQNKMIRYFAEQTESCKAAAQHLQNDDRADEAVFAKIRLNIYEIFNTVFSVAVTTAGPDADKIAAFFLARLRQIPQSWHAALAAAEAHGETEKVLIERIKLETAAEIQKEFETVWEVMP